MPQFSCFFLTFHVSVTKKIWVNRTVCQYSKWCFVVFFLQKIDFSIIRVVRCRGFLEKTWKKHEKSALSSVWVLSDKEPQTPWFYRPLLLVFQLLQDVWKLNWNKWSQNGIFNCLFNFQFFHVNQQERCFKKRNKQNLSFILHQKSSKSVE